MHRLLKRQLKKAGIDENKIPDQQQWNFFLERINQSFLEADQDRYTIERSLHVSSEEMKLLYQQQKDTFEARQQSILNALPDLLFLLDEDGRYVDILADSGSGLLYKTKNDLIGKTLHEVLPKESADEFMQVIQQAIIDNELQVINYKLEVEQGVTHFEGRVTPTGQAVNNKRTVLFLSRDVTEIFRAKSQQNLLSTVMKSAAEGLVVVGSDKKVLYANDAMAKITGISVDALLNDGVGFLRHDLDLALCQDICLEAHVSDHIQREIEIHIDHDTAVPVLINLSTIRDQDNEIEYFVAVLSDMTALKKSKDELKFIATHDMLTNLPNRMMFEDRFKQSIARAKRSKKNGALLFLDLDNFKNINDSLGHSAGDKVLIEIANRLKKLCRADDTVARFGGDEFVLIITDVETQAHAFTFVRKLLDSFQQKINLQGYELDITTSVGMTMFPQQGDQIEPLVQQADTAMYAAKHAGKNRYHLFVNEMLESTVAGFNLDIELHKALENNEFFLQYQPQLVLPDRTFAGFEALIRWQHPQKGVILPGHFIPQAESTGFIDQIGYWVFQKTCEQVVSWSEKGLSFNRVSFNLSRRQLEDADLADNMLDILHLTGANEYTHLIECEITESAIFNEGENAYNNLFSLSESGMLLAIDDFGTGHSSLINLKRFPLNRLKIDQTFVADVGRDSSDEAIIKATVALAKSFNLEVVAEGVESLEQEQFLISIGCHCMQGYLYHYPLSVEDVETLLMNK